MRAILIDDEPLALMQLKKVLENEIAGVEVIGEYQDPIQAFDSFKTITPDVVFLDINMPEKSGLEIAMHIQDTMPNAEIVFITGYDRYALEAFEIYAFDYIMKPLQLERLQKTVERLKQRIRINFQNTEGKEEDTVLHCFNRIMFKKPSDEPKLIKWRTSKAQELFAHLIHHRDKTIDREVLIELLWPDFDPAKGAQQLYTTIYHIRQSIKKAGIETLSISSGSNLDSGYKVHTGNMLIETEDWESCLNRLSPLGNKNIYEHEEVFGKYKGDYLGDYGYLWARGECERLRRLWLNHGRNLSRFYRKTDNVQAALKVNQRIQQMYPEEEESYFELMKLYASINYVSAVEEQYWLLNSMIKKEFNLNPSSKILSWYKNWRKSPDNIS